MSPRGSISSVSSSTSKTTSSSGHSIIAVSRRASSGQPKSSRQQFSACGACRMRRVRCDLKDLSSGPSPSCSNCRERGLKCDEFAEVKAVKLLRRGRRLQQVEAIYGRVSDADGLTSLNIISRLPTIIPKLHCDFFSSQFWRWFCIQVPVLDADEFATRYSAYDSNAIQLGTEGEILARLISVWAVSYGLDERGLATTEDLFEMSEKQKRDQKDRVLAMIRELFELIDNHGLMRRPTWDGLRVLLLILPFLEEHPALEKLSIYNTALTQAQTLCTFTPVCTSGQRDDIVARARLYWHSHVHEGITTALRGGRLALTDVDLQYFQRTLPSEGSSAVTTLSAVSRLFSVPLQLNTICRRIHVHLTGSLAQHRAEQTASLNFEVLRDIWDSLDRCWEDLELLRSGPSDPQHIQDIERYAAAWQICIFECHNIIRENLREICGRSSPTSSPMLSGSCVQPLSSPATSAISVDHAFHMAIKKCFRLLPAVIEIIKSHAPSREESVGSGLFKWDANLVRDGCFFAGVLAANYDENVHRRFFTDDGSVKQEERDLHAYTHFNGDEGVAVVLGALRDMRWIMSLSEERQNAIHVIYETRHRRRFQAPFEGITQPRAIDLNYHASQSQMYAAPEATPGPHGLGPPKVIVHPVGGGVGGSHDRPLLPPLILSGDSPRRVHSAPSTALSTSTDSSGWPTYTPPGTGGSTTGPCVGPHSPFPSPLPYKPETSTVMEETGYYQVQNDMNQFSFNPPAVSSLTPPVLTDSLVASVSPYHHHHRSTTNPSTMHLSPASNYVDSAGVHFSSNAGIVNHSAATAAIVTEDSRACPPFSEEHCGYYQ